MAGVHDAFLCAEQFYADFGKIYRKKVGDYFFTVTEELVEKLCNEFEGEGNAS